MHIATAHAGDPWTPAREALAGSVAGACVSHHSAVRPYGGIVPDDPALHASARGEAASVAQGRPRRPPLDPHTELVGWRLLVVGAEEIHKNPADTLGRAAAILQQRGLPVPVLGDDWRPHFPDRG